MIDLLSRVVGVGVETADMLVLEILLRDLNDRRPSPATRGSPDLPMRVGLAAASADYRVPAMPGSAGAWSNSPGDSSSSRRRARGSGGTGSAPPTGGFEHGWR